MNLLQKIATYGTLVFTLLPRPTFAKAEEIYDKGRLIKIIDRYDDGATKITKFDEQGRLVEMILDENGDGLPDIIRKDRYDLQGRLQERTFDYDADGTEDMILEYGY